MPLLETTHLLIFGNLFCQHIFSNHKSNLLTQKIKFCFSQKPFFTLLHPLFESIGNKSNQNAIFHTYYPKIFPTNMLTPTNTLINFSKIFHPTYLFQLHVYQRLQSTHLMAGLVLGQILGQEWVVRSLFVKECLVKCLAKCLAKYLAKCLAKCLGKCLV